MRLFDTHNIRIQNTLNGVWSLKTESGEKCYITVPGCWENNIALSNYRGTGTFEKEIDVFKDGNLRLVFKGVSHTATVFFDGKEAGSHYNAYTPFSFIVKNVKAGRHKIRVDVSNKFGIFSSLHKPNDYYTYGGITRPAGYEFVPDMYIKNVLFKPYFIDGQWYGDITVFVENISDAMKDGKIKIDIAHKTIESEIKINSQKTECFTFRQRFENVDEWSTDSPNLYFINCRIYENGIVTDDFIDRCGFRRVEISENKISLNGKEIFIKGFNRHEDSGELGCSVPVEMMMKDIWLMKDTGANAVRTSHYPNDERFLDICDETGILVWEENHARGLYLKDMQNPNFDKQCSDCTEEMLLNHINHPSVIIWGILNECASDTEDGRKMYEKQYGIIRRSDDTRPVTSASCRYGTDICLDLADIVSYNLYPGWYFDVEAGKYLEEMLDYAENNGGKNKPFIISEFGGAAMYGFRDPSRRKWSEERQCDILEKTLDAFMNNEKVSGVFIWQFSDCRVTEEDDWFVSRSCMRNNKGIVDIYRRPKLAYETVKRFFTKK